ncbi:MAG TPA: response regulator [Spirochaetota bacterium]|nr:response regulator [Spirochaetota bacterium]
MARGMIVDDSKFMRRIIKEALEEAGHDVVAEAENGFDALEMYKTMKPDFVTMDITMWGKDGLKAVSEITDIDPDARIVVVSALSEKTLRLNEEGIRARAFLTKPFEKSDLIGAINKML